MPKKIVIIGGGVAGLAARFKNRAMGELFKAAFDWHDMSVVFILWTLALMGSGDGGYPIGGSLPLARSMEERYTRLGGKIFFGSKVQKILVEGGRAAGIRLFLRFRAPRGHRALGRGRPRDDLRLARREVRRRKAQEGLRLMGPLPSPRLRVLRGERGFLEGASLPVLPPEKTHRRCRRAVRPHHPH